MNGVLFPLQLVSFSLALPSSRAFSFLAASIYDCDDVEIRSESFLLFLFFKINVTSFRLICASRTKDVFSMTIQHDVDFSLVLLQNFLI
jgi:hypothetical protein